MTTTYTDYDFNHKGIQFNQTMLSS